MRYLICQVFPIAVLVLASNAANASPPKGTYAPPKPGEECVAARRFTLSTESKGKSLKQEIGIGAHVHVIGVEDAVVQVNVNGTRGSTPLRTFFKTCRAVQGAQSPAAEPAEATTGEDDGGGICRDFHATPIPADMPPAAARPTQTTTHPSEITIAASRRQRAIGPVIFAFARIFVERSG